VASQLAETEVGMKRLCHEIETLSSNLAVATFDKEKFQNKSHLMEQRLSTVMSQQVNVP
jgi:hypothetical protein